MGGLAPDNEQPMEDELRETIASYWYRIEESTQVKFNHDYWNLNTPFRSTYKACRAVISAEGLVKNSSSKMVKAIQTAYYQEAINPSLEQTLIDCAKSIGLDETCFLGDFKSQQTEDEFQQHLNMTQHLQVTGFPSLFYVNENNQLYPLTRGFCSAQDLIERFSHVNKLNS